MKFWKLNVGNFFRLPSDNDKVVRIKGGGEDDCIIICHPDESLLGFAGKMSFDTDVVKLNCSIYAYEQTSLTVKEPK